MQLQTEEKHDDDDETFNVIAAYMPDKFHGNNVNTDIL